MFNIGFGEMLVIGIIALLVIGPDKMPEFFRMIAKWLVKMRRSVNDVKHTFQEEFEKVAGDEVKELRSLQNSVNLRRRFNADNIEDLMNKSAEVVERGFKRSIELPEEADLTFEPGSLPANPELLPSAAQHQDNSSQPDTSPTVEKTPVKPKRRPRKNSLSGTSVSAGKTIPAKSQKADKAPAGKTKKTGLTNSSA